MCFMPECVTPKGRILYAPGLLQYEYAQLKQLIRVRKDALPEAQNIVVRQSYDCCEGKSSVVLGVMISVACLHAATRCFRSQRMHLEVNYLSLRAC